MRKSIVAIWGNSGVGTTTFSSAVASAASKPGEDGFNALLVNSDSYCPAFGVWRPLREHTSSLGNLLTFPNLRTDDIASAIELVGDALGLLGYEKDAPIEAYDDVQEKQSENFLRVAKQISYLDTIIVDCQNPRQNAFSMAALHMADLVITLLNADEKGMLFYNSMRSYFDRIRSRGTENIIIPSAICLSDPIEKITDEVRAEKFVLPFIEEAHRKFVNGNLFDTYTNEEYGHIVSVVSKKIRENAGYTK